MGSNSYFNINNSSVNFNTDGAPVTRNSDNPFDRVVASTEQLLEHLDWHSFIRTGVYKEARDRLKDLHVVIMVGRQGSGKTTTARHIIKSLSRTRKPVILTEPSQWDIIPRGPQNFVNVLIDDIFGFDNINPMLKDGWLQKVDFMYNLATHGRVCIIILLRTDMYHQCKEQLSRFKLFMKAHIMSLEDPRYQLTNKEMFEMATSYMKRSRVTHDARESQLNLQSLSTISFPQICSFYASNTRAQARGLEYWQNPIESILEELRALKEQNNAKYFILVLLLIMRGQLPQTFFYRNEETEFEERLGVLRSIRKFIPFNSDQVPTNLETITNSIVGVFLRFSKKDGTYRFIHPVVHDALLLSFNEFHIKDIIDICPVRFLCTYLQIPSCRRAESTLALCVAVEDSIHLAKRFAAELTTGDYLAILDHEALRNKPFVKCLTEIVLKQEGCRHISKRKIGFFKIYKKTFYCCANENWIFSIPDSSYNPLLNDRVRWMCNYKTLLSLIVIKNLEELAFMITKQTILYFDAKLISDSASMMSVESDFCLDKRLLQCACYMGNHRIVRLLLENSQTVMNLYDTWELVALNIASEHESIMLVEFLQKALENTHVLVKNDEYFISMVIDAARLSLLHLKPEYLKQLLKWLRLNSNNLDANISMLCHQLLVQFRSFPTWEEFNLSISVSSPQQHVIPRILKLLLIEGFPQYPGKMIFLAAQHQSFESLGVLLEFCPYVEYVTGAETRLWEKRIATGFSVCEPKGRTALLEASNRCVESVKFLLTSNANTSAQDEDGYTLLHSSLIYSDLSVLQMILSRMQFTVGELSDSAGVTPLHVAAKHESYECFSFLIQYFDDVNQQSINGVTALHETIFSQLDTCEKIQILLQNGADIHVVDKGGNTALHLALKENKINVLSILLKRGATVNQENKQGNTALHIALSDKFSKDCIQLLLQEGANFLCANKTGVTPLYQATFSASVDVLKLFLDQCSEYPVCKRHLNPHPLLASPDFEKINILVRHGFCEASDIAQNCLIALAKCEYKDILNVDNRYTSIFTWEDTNITLENQQFEKSVALMKEKGANVNRPGPDGCTLIQVAIKSSNTRMVEVLLEAGANPNNPGEHQRDHRDLYSYHCLVVHGRLSQSFETLKHLMDRNWQPDVGGHESSILPLIASKKYWKTLELLLRKKNDVNAKSSYGSSSLHESVDSWKCLKVLLTFNPNVDSKDRDGNTVLHLMASEQRCREKIELILNKKANPNVYNNNGETPLLIACKESATFRKSKADRKFVTKEIIDGDTITTYDIQKTEIQSKTKFNYCNDNIKVLLAHKANPDIKDKEGCAAIHIAVKTNNYELLCILLSGGCSPNLMDSHENTPLSLLLISRIKDQINKKNSEIFMKKWREKSLADTQNKENECSNDTLISNEDSSDISVEQMSKTEKDNIISSMECTGMSTDVDTGDIEWEKSENIMSVSGGRPTEVGTSDFQPISDKRFRIEDEQTSLTFNTLSENTEVVRVIDTDDGLRMTQIDSNQCEFPGDKDPIDANCLAEAVICGRFEIWKSIKMLLDNKADPNIKNNYGETPLHYAVMTDCLRSVELLLGANADAKAEDDNSRTPLHRLASCGHTRIARVLLDSGSDVNAKDNNDETALHIAVRAKKYNLVKLLVEKGADVKMTNNNGKTAFDLCRQLELACKPKWWSYKGNKLLRMLEPTILVQECDS